jgi:RimJ/RimL family protein N-acetyltransferase
LIAFEPVVLTGEHVRLEPLALAHVPGLVIAAAEDRSTYEWTPVPDGEVEIRDWVDRAEQDLAAGRSLTFATVNVAENRPVGSTSFLDPQRWPRAARDRLLDSIEIGATWLAASAQRSVVNTDAKLLMLDHAFEAFGVHRVVLNTDVRNERSRTAIARIGATFEGVLHSFRIGVEGTPRDTATFAIPARDWPEVRARLRSRLERA